MPVFEVAPSRDQIAREEALLRDIPGGVTTVLMRAVNKVAGSMRTEIVRRITEELNLGMQAVRENSVLLHPARRETLEAIVEITGKRPGLLAFMARLYRHGIRYAIRRGQPKEIPEAWIATIGGGRGVFARIGAPRLGRRRRRRGPGQGMAGLVRPRFPIAYLRGPSVGEVIGDLPEYAEGVAEEKIAENLDQEIETQTGLLIEHGPSICTPGADHEPLAHQGTHRPGRGDGSENHHLGPRLPDRQRPGRPPAADGGAIRPDRQGHQPPPGR